MPRDKTGNVVRNENFTQVCVWPATLVGDDKIAEFEAFFKAEFDTRIQFLEEVVTIDRREVDRGLVGQGGRSDVLFAVHSADVPRFAIARLHYGIRWIEDVYGNNQGWMYPDRIAEYRTW